MLVRYIVLDRISASLKTTSDDLGVAWGFILPQKLIVVLIYTVPNPEQCGTLKKSESTVTHRSQDTNVVQNYTNKGETPIAENRLC